MGVVGFSSIIYIIMLLGVLYVPLSYRFWRNVEARGLKLRICVLILFGVFIIGMSRELVKVIFGLERPPKRMDFFPLGLFLTKCIFTQHESLGML
jgi:hypothetical protein